MLREESIEEGGIAVLERGHADVLLQVVTLDAQMLQLKVHLFLDRQYPVREQAP